MWGDNGTNIRIYNFTVIGNSTLDPNTFPGNFSAIESVIVQTEVAYYGKKHLGISQFAAVKDGRTAGSSTAHTKTNRGHKC